MFKNKFSWIAIGLSIIGIVGYLIIERQIYVDYQLSVGKTRALFGLKELLGYNEKYYLIILGLICLILTLIAKIKKEAKKHVIIAFTLSFFCLILPIIRVWRIFV